MHSRPIWLISEKVWLSRLGSADLLCIIILFRIPPGGGLGVLGDRKRYVWLDGAQLGTQRFNVGIDGAIVGVLRIFPHAIH